MQTEKYLDEIILMKREKKKKEKYTSLEEGYYIDGKIVHFNESKIMKNFSMYLPDNMDVMSDELAKVKYPSEFRPKVIFTTLDLSVNMGFSIFYRTIKDNEMEKMCERIMTAIKREHMDYRFYGQKKMEKVLGYRFSFRSHAMDNDLFNMMLIAQLAEHTVFSNFNCLYKDYDKWEKVVELMWNTIQSVSKGDELKCGKSK